MTLGAKKFLKRKLRDSTYLELHPGQLDLYHNISLSRALIWSYGSFSPYVLNHLLDSSLFMQWEAIPSCGKYLCFVYLSRNEIIISRASLDSIESKRLVRHNQACFSLVQTLALSLVLIRVYWLDDKGSTLICY